MFYISTEKQTAPAKSSSKPCSTPHEGMGGPKTSVSSGNSGDEPFKWRDLRDLHHLWIYGKITIKRYIYGMFVGFFDIFWGFDGNFMFLFGGMIINWWCLWDVHMEISWIITTNMMPSTKNEGIIINWLNIWMILRLGKAPFSAKPENGSCRRIATTHHFFVILRALNHQMSSG